MFVEQERNIDSFLRSILLPLTALGLALGGQWILLQKNHNPIIGALFFIFAANLYLLSLFRWPHSALEPEAIEPLELSWRPVVRDKRWRAVLMLIALILAIVSYGRFAGNSLDKGFWFWLGSIALFLIASVYRPAGSSKDISTGFLVWWRNIDKRVLLILSVVTILAIFFRFYRLQDIPAEMTSDHAEKILDVQDVLDGDRPIFFPRNTGRELLQFYLTAGIIRLTGLPNSHLALKIGTGIFGIVAVPFTFFLGRMLYGKLAGLLAAFFLAVSHWHVAITRVGLRFPFTAAFIAPVLLFLLRALRFNKRNDWLLAALFLGIGLHTYTAMRIAPLLCAVLVALKLLIDGANKVRKKQIKGADSWSLTFWKNGFLAFSLTLLLLVPIIRYMADDPRGVWTRSFSRLQTDTGLTLPEVASQLLVNLKDTLLMFNYKGDVVAVNTVPSEPVLGLVAGALFVLGSAYLVWRLLVNGDVRSIVLLVSLFFLLLPSIFSVAFPQENPSVVRTGGAIPIVMIIAAVFLATLLLRLGTSPYPIGRAAASVVVVSLILAAVADNYVWYFREYDEQYRRSIWNATEIGAVVQGFEEQGGDVTNVYHIPYPHWVDTRNIGINAGYVRWNNAVKNSQELYDHVYEPRPLLYLLHPADTATLHTLQDLFPNGRVERYNSPREGKDFIIFRVPHESGD